MTAANASPLHAVPQQASSLKMIVTLAGIATISGILLALVYQATFDIIRRNKEAAMREAVFSAVPGAVRQTPFEVLPSGELRPLEEGEPLSGLPHVFAAKDDKGELVGVAIEASGQGYSDVIKILYGYSPQEQTLTGMEVLESKETPGLGDRISDEPFLSEIRGLEAPLGPDEEEVLHPIEAVKHGEKTKPWQIDAVSGATISSKAVGKMLRESTQRMLPIIHRNLAQLGGNE